MENLETQEKIINLGKLFVKELNLEPGVDTFSRWMAHYLADRISVAEQATGSEKENAKRECFDVILKLWAHRHSLPSGKRPFQSFEPILDVLSKINPDAEEPYFYNAPRNQEREALDKNNLENKTVEAWMNIAKDIDKTARIWIQYALEQAVHNAKNDKTRQWIVNAIDVSENSDTHVIKFLIDKNSSFDIETYDKDDFSKQYDIERLKRLITQLQKYSELNEALLKSYEHNLKILQTRI